MTFTHRVVRCWLVVGIIAGLATAQGLAEVPKGVPAGKKLEDVRLAPPKDLNGYFPFDVPKTKEAWEKRAEEVRRRVLVSMGLWPMPTRTPPQAQVYGKVDRDEYTVEKVQFQSFPGFYVTGSLYRPKGKSGKLPAVLCPHGHWPNGRFHDHGNAIQGELKSGGEKFEIGGRHPLQARCVQLARMGCVVFHYDMIGYADSVQIPFGIAHGFAKQRPQMNTPTNWGFFSPQAESRFQSIMGLQTYHSLRAVDFVLELPDVDPSRIAVTGASGGGTQTFLLAAVDARIAAAFPAVMVSTAMQGGCTCENASGLRVGTGNIELAALFAPKPLAMSAANDWTVDLLKEGKGLPELKKLYTMLGVPDLVDGKYFAFGHNYNYVSRAYMYEWFNKHLKLGQTSPIVERDFKPLTQAELSVWDADHPKPLPSEEIERVVCKAWHVDAQSQLAAVTPKDAKSLADYRRLVGGAFDVVIGRTLPEKGKVDWENRHEKKYDAYMEYAGVLKHAAAGEQTPAIFLQPHKWNKQVVIWVDAAGKAGLYDTSGGLRPGVKKLIEAGTAVAGLDVLHTGEFLADGQPVAENPVVKNPREFAGYTYGYNHSLLARRAHDILGAIAFVRTHEEKPERVHLLGLGAAGPWAIAAAAQAGAALDRVAVDTAGQRLASAMTYRDVNFLPGAVKYGDLPGMLSLVAPRPLWLAGEMEAPAIVTAAYGAAGSAEAVSLFKGTAEQKEAAALDWLMKN